MEIKIKNYMEKTVEELVDGVMKDTGMCMCERCKADVMAIALNHLPTKYIVTESGERFAKLSALGSQYNVTAITELAKAAEIVKSNKRHE